LEPSAEASPLIAGKQDRIESVLQQLTACTLKIAQSAQPTTASSTSSQAGIQRMMKMEPIKEWDPKTDPFFYAKGAINAARQAYHDVKTTKDLLLLGNPIYQEKLQHDFQIVYEKGVQLSLSPLANEWFLELRRSFVRCLDAKKYQERRI